MRQSAENTHILDSDIREAVQAGKLSYKLAIVKQFNRTNFDLDVERNVSNKRWNREVALIVQFERNAKADV